MTRLEELLEHGIIDEVYQQLKTGKEAEVWLVSHHGEAVAAKLYKAREFRSFKNDAGYLEGRTVRNSRTQRAMDKGSRFGREASEEAWKSAEADALFTLHAAGVHVPKPVLFYEGVLLMEVVGDAEGRVAPRLIDAGLTREQAEPLYLQLRADVITMLCNDLIHGDLSPFNVLVGTRGAVIIDFPQVVAAAKNSRSEHFFKRDLGNLHTFFLGVDPALARFAHDADDIWRAYVRRELSPGYTPRPPRGPHGQGGGDRRGPGGSQRGREGRGGPRERRDFRPDGGQRGAQGEGRGAPQERFRQDGGQRGAQGDGRGPPRERHDGQRGAQGDGRGPRQERSRQDGGQRSAQGDGRGPPPEHHDRQRGAHDDGRGPPPERHGGQRSAQADGRGPPREHHDGQRGAQSDGRGPPREQHDGQRSAQDGRGPPREHHDGAQSDGRGPSQERSRQDGGQRGPPQERREFRPDGGQRRDGRGGPPRDGGQRRGPDGAQRSGDGPGKPKSSGGPRAPRPDGPVVSFRGQAAGASPAPGPASHGARPHPSGRRR